MNRNFIFVFILLVTLSVVNAAPWLRFFDCPVPHGHSKPVLISMAYTPDPLVSGQSSKFDVSGTLKEDIGSDTTLEIGFIDLTDLQNPVPIAPFPAYSDTFSGVVIKAGNPFKTTAQLTVPKLPASYAIGALIENSPGYVPGCAIKMIEAPLSSLSYPIAEK
ncbi:hypothetical protein Glove_444g13 [Diversispora epigaea]|uniref:MD-2-related lipid-recognition domain-containing protein n=1 Tax=Diversispora epigaea TaxID=1348612 RepID=A0A397GQ29_9GLOM|nr:hypothetical protein Glove_444g13 [Diversispora epigaea]